MEELNVKATKEGMKIVLNVMEQTLERVGCPSISRLEFAIALEELFVNIVNYAYEKENGYVRVEYEILSKDENKAVLKTMLADSGIAYNPLLKQDPDIQLSTKERQVGGLGIFMAKKILDSICYERREGENCLTFEKCFDCQL